MHTYACRDTQIHQHTSHTLCRHVWMRHLHNQTSWPEICRAAGDSREKDNRISPAAFLLITTDLGSEQIFIQRVWQSACILYIIKPWSTRTMVGFAAGKHQKKMTRVIIVLYMEMCECFKLPPSHKCIKWMQWHLCKVSFLPKYSMNYIMKGKM